jgi:ABC-type sugar transport system permease subunit
MPVKLKISKKMWPFIFAAPFVISYILFNLYPVIYSFILSLNSWNGISEKEFVGFANYTKILTRDVLFRKAVFNTFMIMFIATPTAIFGGLTLAYFLFNMRKGKQFFQTINFFPYITTPVAIGFIFSYLFDYSGGYVNQLMTSLGLLNEKYYWLEHVWSARGIVMLMIIWRNLGYYMTIYLSGMTAIPSEVYEAARIDGASKIQIFSKVTVPLLENTTIFLALTSVIGGLQLFDEPYQLYTGWTAGYVNVGGPKYSVLTVIWKFYDDSFKSNSMLGYGAAVSFLLFLIIFAISLLQLKYISKKAR